MRDGNSNRWSKVIEESKKEENHAPRICLIAGCYILISTLFFASIVHMGLDFGLEVTTLGDYLGIGLFLAVLVVPMWALIALAVGEKLWELVRDPVALTLVLWVAFIIIVIYNT